MSLRNLLNKYGNSSNSETTHSVYVFIDDLVFNQHGWDLTQYHFHLYRKVGTTLSLAHPSFGRSHPLHKSQPSIPYNPGVHCRKEVFPVVRRTQCVWLILKLWFDSCFHIIKTSFYKWNLSMSTAYKDQGRSIEEKCFYDPGIKKKRHTIGYLWFTSQITKYKRNKPLRA